MLSSAPPFDERYRSWLRLRDPLPFADVSVVVVDLRRGRSTTLVLRDGRLCDEPVDQPDLVIEFADSTALSWWSLGWLDALAAGAPVTVHGNLLGLAVVQGCLPNPLIDACAHEWLDAVPPLDSA